MYKINNGSITSFVKVLWDRVYGSKLKTLTTKDATGYNEGLVCNKIQEWFNSRFTEILCYKMVSFNTLGQIYWQTVIKFQKWPKTAYLWI